MISVHSITYNEETLLPFWQKWWEDRVEDCNLTIHDNQSSDRTAKMLSDIDIETFDSGGKFDDRLHRDIKNNCWKKEEKGWKFVSDLDELPDIWKSDLYTEELLGTSILRFQGFDIINVENVNSLDYLKYGVRNPRLDKYLCFNSKDVIEINGDYGLHNIYPKGKIKYSKKVYNLYHFKYISEEYYINRTKLYQERFEEWNKSVGHGAEYFKTEEELRDNYRKLKEKAIKI